MGRSFVLMLLLTVFAHAGLLAQSKKITGKISASDNGTMLSGATVKVKGTNITTTTDADGVFTIEAASNAILTITANNAFAALNSVGNNSAVNIQSGAALTIGDATNNFSSTLSSNITETGAAAQAPSRRTAVGCSIFPGAKSP